MTSVPPTRDGYPADLRALTSLRAFLALGVVLFHYQLQWDPALGFSPIIERSRLAVDAFFMLSGFILAHVYGPAFASGGFNYRRFIVARLARLYPLHIAVLTGALIMVLGATAAGVRFNAEGYGVLGFFQTLFLIQSWFPTNGEVNWSGPSWSLSAEWFAYLLFPAYAWLALRLRTRPWVLLGIGAAAFVVLDAFYVQAFGKVLPRAEDSLGILRIAPEFLVGMALYGLGHRWRWSPPVAAAAALSTTVLLLGAMQLSLDDRIIVALAAPVILTWSLLARADCEGPLSTAAILRYASGGNIPHARRQTVPAGHTGRPSLARGSACPQPVCQPGPLRLWVRAGPRDVKRPCPSAEREDVQADRRAWRPDAESRSPASGKRGPEVRSVRSPWPCGRRDRHPRSRP